VTNQADSPDGSAYAPELRRRADHLIALAASIERSLVMTLIDDDTDAFPCGDQGRLCRTLLDRSLHQLHRAADDLRTTAHRFRSRADELDAAFEAAA
jgi:hypothetical protein